MLGGETAAEGRVSEPCSPRLVEGDMATSSQVLPRVPSSLAPGATSNGGEPPTAP